VNHIRFESARNVCEYPRVLGHETIIVDHSREICKNCMGLIMSYNERINNYELALAIPMAGQPVDEDPLAAARGILVGFALATILWLALYVVVSLL